MASTPKINETYLLETLRDEHTPRTPTFVRQLNDLTLVACFDRQIKREFFIEMLDLRGEIDIMLSAIEGAGALRHSLLTLDPNREPALIDGQITFIVKNLMRKRADFAEKFALVTQCPTPDDKIS